MLHNDLKKSPTQETKQQQKYIKFYAYESSNPWWHCAAQVGKNGEYVSPYPKTHTRTGSQRAQHAEDINHDSSDYSAKVLGLWDNILKPMFYIDMHFADHQERKQYPKQKVKVPVTDEQFEKAKKFAEEYKTNPPVYSILALAGDHCAMFNQKLLDIITDNHEKHIIQPKSHEQIIVLPSNVYERATNLAKMRKGEVSFPTVSNNSNFLFGGKTTESFIQAFNQSMDEKRERLTGGLSLKKN